MPRVKLIHVQDHQLNKYQPDQVHNWTDAELLSYLMEALREDIEILPEEKKK